MMRLQGTLYLQAAKRDQQRAHGNREEEFLVGCGRTPFLFHGKRTCCSQGIVGERLPNGASATLTYTTRVIDRRACAGGRQQQADASIPSPRACFIARGARRRLRVDARLRCALSARARQLLSVAARAAPQGAGGRARARARRKAAVAAASQRPARSRACER
eukprot:2665846-Pleurochrysis_carterae.AAC.2